MDSADAGSVLAVSLLASPSAALGQRADVLGRVGERVAGRLQHIDQIDKGSLPVWRLSARL
jgi:hypothetical protein